MESPLPLYYEGNAKKTIFPQNYVYVLRTTRTRHMVSFIDFYFHFLGNFHYHQSNVRWLLPAYDYCFFVCTVLNDLITAHLVVVGSWEEPPNIWLRVAKNAFVGWALNVWIRMLFKGAVRKQMLNLKNKWDTWSNHRRQYTNITPE